MNPSARNESLFRRWLAEHQGILVKVSRAYASNARDQEELRHEMGFQLWRSAERFSGKAKESTWVYRVCLNTALAWLRGKRLQNQIAIDEASMETLRSESSAPAEALGDKELLELLYAAVRRLPETERGLLLLHLDGLGYQEMAEISGLTENHVGVVLTRARKRLAALMKGVVDETN